MSTTEIYGFKADGNAEFIGETQNAFRGAFVVWEHFEKNTLSHYSQWLMAKVTQEL
ncbi:hypothetical protein ACOBWA_08630 [Psychrobacter sp. ER1]|uniref:hypothetical protein n=1 Tax=Psychrobacter sp. ER1 TaxID=3406645 RepID=UPI003B436036